MVRCPRSVLSAGCRQLQAGSLRSPEIERKADPLKQALQKA